MKAPDPLTRRIWLTAIGITLFALAFFALASCTTTRTIEHQTVRVERDTLHIIDHQRDSVYHRDSVILIERWKGDTLIRETTREILKYRDRLKTDTIYKTIYKTATTQHREETKHPPDIFQRIGGRLLTFAFLPLAFLYLASRLYLFITRR